MSASSSGDRPCISGVSSLGDRTSPDRREVEGRRRSGKAPMTWGSEETKVGQEKDDEDLDSWTEVHRKKSLTGVPRWPVVPRRPETQGWPAAHERRYPTVPSKHKIESRASIFPKAGAKPNPSNLNSKSGNFKFDTGTKGCSWRDIYAPSNQTNVVSSLRFIQPSIDVQGKPFALIPEAVTKRNDLVGYVMGDRPYYMHLKACVNRIWRTTCSLDVFVKDNGAFVFKFGSKEECDRILLTGPWFFNGRLIVLRRWKLNMGVERDMFGSVPVWVRFPNLPLDFWDADGISHVASVIGTPVFMDEATAKENRFGYARCFIEISATFERRTHINVTNHEGVSVEVKVEFEWIPPSCPNCECFGHLAPACPMKKVWIPKQTMEGISQGVTVLDTEKNVGEETQHYRPLENIAVDTQILNVSDIGISPNSALSTENPPH